MERGNDNSASAKSNDILTLLSEEHFSVSSPVGTRRVRHSRKKMKSPRTIGGRKLSLKVRDSLMDDLNFFRQYFSPNEESEKKWSFSQSMSNWLFMMVDRSYENPHRLLCFNLESNYHSRLVIDSLSKEYKKSNQFLAVINAQNKPMRKHNAADIKQLKISIVKSLAYSIVENIPELRSIMSKQIKNFVPSLETSSLGRLIDFFLMKPLSKYSMGREHEELTKYLFIDGFDFAPSISNFRNFLQKKLLKRFKWLRIVLTVPLKDSMHHVNTRTRNRCKESIYLPEDLSNIMLTSYIDTKLRELQDSNQYLEIEKYSREIFSQSEGMFFIAETIISELSPGFSKQDIDHVCDRLYHLLHTQYSNQLSRILKRGKKSVERDDLISMLFASKQLLSLEFLGTALNQSDQSIQGIISQLAPLVVVGVQPCSLEDCRYLKWYHKSFEQWISKGYDLSLDYHIDSKRGNHLLLTTTSDILTKLSTNLSSLHNIESVLSVPCIDASLNDMGWQKNYTSLFTTFNILFTRMLYQKCTSSSSANGQCLFREHDPANSLGNEYNFLSNAVSDFDMDSSISASVWSDNLDELKYTFAKYLLMSIHSKFQVDDVKLNYFTVSDDPILCSLWQLLGPLYRELSYYLKTISAPLSGKGKNTSSSLSPPSSSSSSSSSWYHERVWAPVSVLAPDLIVSNVASSIKSHNDWIFAVCLLSDGRIASASADKTISVFSPNTTAYIDDLISLQGHKDWVLSLAELPGGKLVSGSWDKTIRVWHIASRTCLLVLTGHTDVVRTVISLPRGRIASGSDDKTIRIWDIATGDEVSVLRGHTWSILSLALHSDGTLISGSWDRTIRVWAIDAQQCLRVLRGHEDGILTVVSLPDTRIASGSADTTIRLWDLSPSATLSPEVILSHHSEAITSLAVSYDCMASGDVGGVLVSGSDDRTIAVWDLQFDRKMYTLKKHTDRVSSVSVSSGCGWSRESKLIVSAGRDNQVVLWRAEELLGQVV